MKCCPHVVRLSTENYVVPVLSALLKLSPGVFGGLQLHGRDPGLTKTYLATTVSSGNTISVTDAVNWQTGHEIMLTTTDMNPHHTEVFRITDINGNSITLNTNIKYRHIGQLLFYKTNIYFVSITRIN